VELKREETLFEIGQGSEIVRGEDLSLNNREVDLYLIEPTGMSQVTFKNRLQIHAPGLTPTAVLKKLGTIQMIDVWIPTRDARWLILLTVAAEKGAKMAGRRAPVCGYAMAECGRGGDGLEAVVQSDWVSSACALSAR
jgi:hypothetical protein